MNSNSNIINNNNNNHPHHHNNKYQNDNNNNNNIEIIVNNHNQILNSNINYNIHRKHINNSKNNHYLNLHSQYIDGKSKQINKCLNTSQDNNSNNNSNYNSSNYNKSNNSNSSNSNNYIDNNRDHSSSNNIDNNNNNSQKEFNIEDYEYELDDDDDDDDDDKEYINNGSIGNNNNNTKIGECNDNLKKDNNRCEICCIKYKRLVSLGSSSIIKNSNSNNSGGNDISSSTILCKHQMCKKCSIKTFEGCLEKNKDICCIWCGEMINEILVSELLGIDYKSIIENKKSISNSLLKWDCPSCQFKSFIIFNNSSKNLISVNSFNNINSNNNSNNGFSNINQFNNNSNNNNNNKQNNKLNNNKTITCKKCNYIFCFNCNESHGVNQSCEEFLMKDESLLKTIKWKQSNTKRCPSCFVFIEKRGGCSFMRCLNCSCEFCFECLSTYKKFHQCDNSEMIFKIIFMICAIIGSIYIVYLLKKVN